MYKYALTTSNITKPLQYNEHWQQDKPAFSIHSGNTATAYCTPDVLIYFQESNRRDTLMPCIGLHTQSTALTW